MDKQNKPHLKVINLFHNNLSTSKVYSKCLLLLKFILKFILSLF